MILNFIFALLIVLLIAVTIVQRRRILELKRAENRQWINNEAAVRTKILLAFWIGQIDPGKELAAYLDSQGIHSIAIYGMTEMGSVLNNILTDTSIDVVCAVDRNKALITGLKLLSPDEFQGGVDAVIVTAIYYFSEIYDSLYPKLGDQVKIICLDELIYDMYQWKKASGAGEER